jgi:sugar phosphate isomerase/epimerase
MGMDALAVVTQIGERAAHCHGKDVAFLPANLAVNGLLDHRWPRPAEQMPWNFAVVGRGKDQSWWNGFIAALVAHGTAHTIAIEHEDPFATAEVGIGEAASVLSRALEASDIPAAGA